ncbi:hypothetical protein C8Q74DRAFT_189796 [Fomes fomentarius]|nr:hypothetical protein C8Q74DRAFT_189796 [Fomes fomentarius]
MSCAVISTSRESSSSPCSMQDVASLQSSIPRRPLRGKSFFEFNTAYITRCVRLTAQLDILHKNFIAILALTVAAFNSAVHAQDIPKCMTCRAVAYEQTGCSTRVDDVKCSCEPAFQQALTSCLTAAQCSAEVHQATLELQMTYCALPI